jgi:hydrogenase nickel incorporation protein HypA/HybF
MHELAVTEHLFDLTLRYAQKQGAVRVTDVYLVIGDLSSLVDESVQFYWDLITEDSVARGSELHFERIPASLRCRSCEIDYTPSDGNLSCPQCNGMLGSVVAGNEFYLEAIEVDMGEGA